MGALCSYGRTDKLSSIDRSRSLSSYSHSLTKNYLFLQHRQQSKLISNIQLETLTSSRFLNAGLEKVNIDHIVSSADKPVPDDVTFRNTPGFFPRLLEEVTRPRPERHRLGLLSGQTWSSYVSFFQELLATLHSASPLPTLHQVKTLYFVRHGEAIHNVAEQELGQERWEAVEALSEHYFDPPLTETGIEEVSTLGTYISHALTEEGLMVDCIIVSPLTRAIESAQLAFAQIWTKVPIICLENARETIGVHTCDRRRTKAELKELYPNIIFDLLRDGPDPLWDSNIREADLDRLHRAARLVNFVFSLPYKYIAIVAHGGIIRAATTIMMAEAEERVEWLATTLEPSDIYGYQVSKGDFLPVCAHRRILPNSQTGISRTMTRPSVSFSAIDSFSQP